MLFFVGLVERPVSARKEVVSEFILCYAVNFVKFSISKQFGVAVHRVGRLSQLRNRRTTCCLVFAAHSTESMYLAWCY